MIEKLRVFNGDCLDVMAELIANGEKFDSVVCDPPYHLTSIVKRFGGENAAPAQFGTDGAYSRASKGFMGKEWDGGDIAFRIETWRLCFELLKDGGHLLAFSGTRTYHRMAVAIEDAGFEIRDQIGWLYGSGFPKSHNISKAIDKINGAEREIVGTRVTNVGMQGGNFANKSGQGEINITAAASEEAQQWEGWGTALKPAWEPVVVARKPISEKSIAANVLKHGTGAINIDGCRVGSDGGTKDIPNGHGVKSNDVYGVYNSCETKSINGLGRWPANIIHDGSEEVVAAFPAVADSSNHVRKNNSGSKIFGGTIGIGDSVSPYSDSGNASRFFYSAKAQEEDRMGSKHPTVKPIDLMAYLCRMVTPPNGHVLDPFAGSGSTGIGAIREGFHATLIEREPEYYQDILNRTRHIKGEDLPLFNDEKELL